MDRNGDARVRAHIPVELILIVVLAILVAILVFTPESSTTAAVAATAQSQSGYVSQTDLVEAIEGHDAVITMRDHSYIPIPLLNPHRPTTIKAIFEVLNHFEDAHPELKMGPWHLNVSIDTPGFVYGVFIDHQPKTPPQK